MKKSIFTIIVFNFLCSSLWSQQLAFPGVEGHGKYTVGGRGGQVYEVTNLNDSGSGSLRAAVEASGARTVVFRVSGTITLESKLVIRNPYITIAGQTAPGDGICIRKFPLDIGTEQVIVRYLRLRLGDESGGAYDAMWARYYKNIVLDHVSASWSIDETVSIYFCENATVQWCVLSESLYHSLHEKGNHGYGGIWGGYYSTYHHNLLAHHTSRNPRFAGTNDNVPTSIVDFRNNVTYNWGYNSAYGGESARHNIVNNYYKKGPATKSGAVSYRIVQPSDAIDQIPYYSKWYVTGNYVVGNATVTNDNWAGGVQPYRTSIPMDTFKVSTPFPDADISTQSAEEAYISVLQNAGATLPKRDIIDTRVIDETKNGYATYGASYGANKGIIDTPSDVGGWPILNSLPAPADTDHDGMPDYWEDAHALDKSDASDRNTVGADGYTMLEVYLNSIEFNYPVTNIYFTNFGDNNIKVVWDDNYLAEDGFIIEKSTNGTDFTIVDSVGININSWIDPNQDVNSNLKYRIVAYHGDLVTPISADFVENSSIEITPVSSINVGDTIQLQATLLPENSSNKTVNWSVRSGDESKASISESGLLIALDAGTVQVTAETADGTDLTSTLDIEINPVITGINSSNTQEINFKSFPNPSAGGVTFTWYSPVSALVNIRIYDLNGVVVSNVIQKEVGSRNHSVEWDGKDNNGSTLPAGYYLCEISVDGVRYVQPLLRN